MNKFIKIILFQLLFNLSLFGQTTKYKIEQKEFFYIEFDIRGNSIQPIIMGGLTENINLKYFSTKDINSFINDFYKTSFYTPEIALNGYNALLSEFMGNENAIKYLKENPDIGVKTANKISEKSIKKEVQLDSGEIVYLQITKIKGSFWAINSDNKVLVTNSNELNIKEIKNIKKCYIPFEITCYIKPKRKEIN